ncbi:putative DsbA family dithiol-disulfide isomerase [Isoptericola jiangsuensis]|uniref:Putative DsbA family dithiol-disulfide isomerase n=1 Tax=Isoptericola jiangsuensis TaxID=548579 RepID=A0A2A9EXE4_9MICO|nr:DsbA family oxidoreductase [Isoptericola jiangsuensis]PFG42982.1 putative DsbA family dithiol-disulfide isomerase [Isoptericola jiangsuensis]
MPTVHVDIWSDIACPFCYVGKRNFESAVAASDVDVEVTYRSFQLSPDLPEDVTGSHAEMLAAKMGVDVDTAHGMEARTTGLAHEVGLDFDYAALHPANTLLAHRLLHLAKAHGLQGAMKERLLAAYFTQGRHVGRLDELVDLAAEVGLDADEVRTALTGDAYTADVAQDVAQAAAYGIRGVPFFVLDGRLAVSGAQPPEVFAQALRQATEQAA